MLHRRLAGCCPQEVGRATQNSLAAHSLSFLSYAHAYAPAFPALLSLIQIFLAFPLLSYAPLLSLIQTSCASLSFPIRLCYLSFKLSFLSLPPPSFPTRLCYLSFKLALPFFAFLCLCFSFPFLSYAPLLSLIQTSLAFLFLTFMFLSYAPLLSLIQTFLAFPFPFFPTRLCWGALKAMKGHHQKLSQP